MKVPYSWSSDKLYRCFSAKINFCNSFCRTIVRIEQPNSLKLISRAQYGVSAFPALYYSAGGVENSLKCFDKNSFLPAIRDQ